MRKIKKISFIVTIAICLFVLTGCKAEAVIDLIPLRDQEITKINLKMIGSGGPPQPQGAYKPLAKEQPLWVGDEIVVDVEITNIEEFMQNLQAVRVYNVDSRKGKKFRGGVNERSNPYKCIYVCMNDTGFVLNEYNHVSIMHIEKKIQVETYVVEDGESVAFIRDYLAEYFTD